MKNKILQLKFIPALLFFLIIAASVSANEVIKLNQFNNYLKQARDLIASEKPQEALKVLQQAKEKVNTTLLVKAFKNEEIKNTEKEIEEIKRLTDEKVKGVAIEKSETSTPSLSTNLNNSFRALISTPQPVVSSPTAIPTEIDWEQFNRELNEKLKEVREPDNNSPSKPPSYVYDPYYPIILSLSDNKGGQNKYSQYNQYPLTNTSFTGITLRIGDTIKWKAEASDPKGRQILYNFHSNSQRFSNQFGIENGNYKYTTNNEIEYIITEEDLKDAGEILTIVLVIKSEKDRYRAGSSGYDDRTNFNYKLQPN